MYKGIFYGIVGAAIYDLLKKAPAPRLYAWKCPDPECGFKVLTNKRANTDLEILQHQEEAHNATE